MYFVEFAFCITVQVMVSGCGHVMNFHCRQQVTEAAMGNLLSLLNDKGPVPKVDFYVNFESKKITVTCGTSSCTCFIDVMT